MSSSPIDLTHPATPTTRLTRPGWPEIALGIGVAVALLLLTPLIIVLVPEGDPQLLGLVLMSWSVVVPFGGFAAAMLIRIRSWAAFGVRRTTWRWMLAAVALGIGAFLVKGLVNMAVIAIVGVDANAQVPYYDAADSGLLPLIATIVTISLLVPLGEEFLFRGVLMRGLLRYGAVIAVVVSSVVFAVFHGVNMALPSALVVGLVAAEVVRRSGSVWPAVVIHVINNLAAPVFVLLGGAAAA